MTTTSHRRALLAELVDLQNRWEHQDILTITGFMSDAELEEHIARYRELVARQLAR
jgi:hypothetical protein